MKPEVKISLIYAAIGMLWIAFSDTYLGLLFQGMDTGTLVQFQLLKGISYVTITARQNTNHLDIMVTDNGIGIAPEELPSIFQLFYRTKSTAGSSHTGLGLALAKKIMLQIGGDIHVTSVCNQGSVFTVSVPVTEYQGDPDV